MALTDAQKATIRMHFGYSDTARSTSFESAITSLSAEAEAKVVVILTQLDTIDTILAASWTRQLIHQAEDGVRLAGHDEIIALRAEGQRLIMNISSIIGVTPARTPYTGASQMYAY